MRLFNARWISRGTPRRLQLLASDAPSLYRAANLPSGLTLSGGTPTGAGVFPFTFYPERDGRLGSAAFTLEISPPATSPNYADGNRLSPGDDFTVNRTPGTEPNLTWVIRRNGVELLSRLVRDELSHRYDRNFESGSHTIRLEAFLAGAYRVVSNTVSYSVGAELGRELLAHSLGAINGDATTYLAPRVGSSRMADRRLALSLTYTVNLAGGTVTATLEQSSNLRDWVPVSPERRILGGDETFELREDLVPIESGPSQFHRVKFDHAQP